MNCTKNDALGKAIEAKLARKTIANHKHTAKQTQLPFAQLLENMHQGDIFRTLIAGHKTITQN